MIAPHINDIVNILVTIDFSV